MYLITLDPDHGLVAAPRSQADIDTITENALHAYGFRWDDTIEAYTNSTDTDDDTVVQVALLLTALDHCIRVVA
ncbi:hypothetical protein [Streptomyces sp. x-19]|uniref:hypothetical protein n=1 Tax=Streptomyces sp. x-19 TaxID=2789280 RepID=UPI00397EF39E